MELFNAVRAHCAVALAAIGVALDSAALHRAEPAVGPLPHPAGEVVIVVPLVRVTKHSSAMLWTEVSSSSHTHWSLPENGVHLHSVQLLQGIHNAIDVQSRAIFCQKIALKKTNFQKIEKNTSKIATNFQFYP